MTAPMISSRLLIFTGFKDYDIEVIDNVQKFLGEKDRLPRSEM